LGAGRMEGATGHMVTVFAFRNRSGEACRMNGFPSIEVRDTNDRPVPIAIKYGTGFMLRGEPPSDVALGPDGEAFFGVEWTSICAFELGGGGGWPTHRAAQVGHDAGARCPLPRWGTRHRPDPSR
jgi:hypothetical protein